MGILDKRVYYVFTLPIRKLCFSIDSFIFFLVIDSSYIFSLGRHPKYSTTEYCLILSPFIEMFKVGECLFSLLKKRHLVLFVLNVWIVQGL